MNNKPFTVVGYDTVLWFGKYRGHMVSDVADADPQYLLWAHDEIDWFHLDEDIEEGLRMEDAESDGYYDLWPLND